MLKNLVAMLMRGGYEIRAFCESSITVLHDGKPLTIPATYDEVLDLLGC